MADQYIRRSTRNEYAEAPVQPQPGQPHQVIAQPITDGTIAVLDKRALLIGGFANGTSQSQVLEYDFATKQWQPFTSLPAKRSEATCAVGTVNGQQVVVVFGGWDDAKATDDTWILRPSTTPEGRLAGQWETLETATECTSALEKPPARRLHAMTGHTNASGAPTALLFGGFDGTARRMNDLWEFDFASLKWRCVETHGNVPTPRDGAAIAADPHAQKLYVFGGFTHARVSDLFVLDLASGEWSRMPSISCPAPRYGCFSVCSGPAVLFGLGQDAHGPSSVTFQYHTVDQKWTVVSFEGDEIDARVQFSAGAAEGGKKVLIFGGTNERKYSSSLYELELEKGEPVAAPTKKK